MVDATISAHFDAAAREALAFLQKWIGFDLWMVTQVKQTDWIVLQAQDQGYGIAEGENFRWLDSFCWWMIAGKGPRIAPRSRDIPAYNSAPIGEQISIESYIGVPLLYSDGSLFGTLCAIHPEPQPDAIASKLPLVEAIAELLSRLLDADLKLAQQAKQAEQAEAVAMKDVLTDLYNRRGWNRRLVEEEARCRRQGYSACIIAVDLDGLKEINDCQGHVEGDRVIRQAGQLIRNAVRQHDIVARVGGDEFAILSTVCTLAVGESLLKRIRRSFALKGIEASFGMAFRSPSNGLWDAWECADQAMYRCKRKKKLRHYLLKRLA